MRRAAVVVCVVSGLWTAAPPLWADAPPDESAPAEAPDSDPPASEAEDAPPPAADSKDDTAEEPEADTAGAPEPAPDIAKEPEAEPEPGPDEAPAPVQDPEKARLHVRLGRAYYGTGRFDEAAREFERAHELSSQPELLYDLFLARRDAGHIASAIEALEQFLDQVPNAPERDRLTARLNNMRRLQARRSADRDSEESGAGAEPDARGTAAATEGTEAVRVPSDAPPPRAALPAPELEEPEGRSIAPWLVMGLGAALIIGGTTTGALALRSQRRLDRLCGDPGLCPPDSGFEAQVSRGRTLATATDVLLGLGIASLGAGVALFFLLDDLTARAPTRPDGPTASVGCSHGGCVGTMRMAF
jgi:tetratricopeptide (TPR) repeat protein